MSSLENLLILGLGVGLPAVGLMAMMLARTGLARVCGLGLVLTGPALALFAASRTPPDAGPPSAEELELYLTDVTDVQAVTDKGRPVQLKRANTEDHGRFIDLQRAFLREHPLGARVTLLSDAWRTCNCHGLVFSGGRYFILSEEVDAILEDNGYTPVSVPRPLDLAVYRDDKGEVAHIGLVRAVRADAILVESKWGWGGLFLHPHEAHPYAPATCVFYRSERAGHLLQGLGDAVQASAR